MRGTPIRAAVLILMLVASCAQCIARCADSGPRVPPCHRQQQSKAPVECHVPVLLVSSNHYMLVGVEPAEPLVVAIVWQVDRLAAPAAAEPDLPPPNPPAVLRI